MPTATDLHPRQSAIRVFASKSGKAAEVQLRDGLPKDADCVWLHLDGRAAEAHTWLDAQSDIPVLAREALYASETRPRIAVFGHGVIVNLRGLGATPEDDPDPLVSTRFWAERGRIISLSYRSPLALEPAINAFLAGQIADPGDLLSTYARAITDELDPEVAKLGDGLDGIEERIDQDHARSTRRKVNDIRARAIAYRRFIAPQREALDRLAQSRAEWLDSEDHHQLRESADRYSRMADELEAVRERAAIVHDELTDLRAELIDARALLLSIVALIFLPLTFITGLLGMNVEGIPFAKEPWAFWGVVGLCGVLGIVILIYFILARWVRGR